MHRNENCFSVANRYFWGRSSIEFTLSRKPSSSLFVFNLNTAIWLQFVSIPLGTANSFWVVNIKVIPKCLPQKKTSINKFPFLRLSSGTGKGESNRSLVNPDCFVLLPNKRLSFNLDSSQNRNAPSGIWMDYCLTTRRRICFVYLLGVYWVERISNLSTV